MKRFRLTLGLLVGLLLGASTNALAAVGDTVQAVFAEFSYIVNGESVTLESPVLVHEGNSYLRTTQVANLLGYDVTYKADSRTIEFTGTLPPAPITTEPSAEPDPSTSTEPTDTTETTSPEPSPEPTAPTDTTPKTEQPTTEPSEPVTQEPEQTTEPTPEPEPSNIAACQAIRDSYNSQIVGLSYKNLTQGQYNLQKYQLELYRDQKLAAEGCQ